METVDVLNAIEKIGRLKAMYFRCIDTKAWDGLRHVFTHDARISFPESGIEEVSLDSFIETSRDFMEHCVSIHRGYMPEIEVTGVARATGIWAMEDQIFFNDAGQWKTGLAKINGFGHYHEEYRHDGAGWRISMMRLTRVRRQDTTAAVTAS